MSKTPTWVPGFKSRDGSIEVENVGGVSWTEAPARRRLHVCRPQTRGWVGYFTRVYRCACGAISSDGRRWSDRNSRRTRHRPHPGPHARTLFETLRDMNPSPRLLEAIEAADHRAALRVAAGTPTHHTTEEDA